MIKKWSYVAAAMLTVASGLALTSCIDNDEPFGIREIRVATANLLEAKKSAVNAEQAAKEAEIEIQKIWAEVEKMKVEKDKILAEADAKIKEAQAKAIELEAQAAAAKTEAEAEELKAKADYWYAQAEELRAYTEVYVKTQQAHIDELIAQAEIRVKDSQLKYDQALYRFEQEKAKNADKANYRLYKAWETAFTAYLEQLDVVNGKTQYYYQKVKDYARAEVDLVPVMNGKEQAKDANGNLLWESKNYDALKSLQKSVADAQAAIDFTNKVIEKYQEWIQDLENITSTDLYQKFEQYEAEAKANEEELVKAQTEKAVLPIENKELYQAIEDLQNQVNKFDQQKIEIPAYTWDPKEIDATAFDEIGLSDPEVIVPAGAYFTLASTDTYYDQYTGNYTSQINKLKNYLLDANDIAWTNARINELKTNLAKQNKLFDEAKTNWENAKTAYNNGKKPEDYSVIPMEDDVQAAVDALNACSTEYTALRNAYQQAKADKEAAYKEAEKLLEKYQNDPESAVCKLAAAAKTRDEAKEANKVTYEKAKAAAEKETDKVRAEQKSNVDAKQRDVDAKLEIYQVTLKANDYDETNEDVVKAKEAWSTAEGELSKAQLDQTEAVSEAEADETAAILKAKIAQINADKAADDKYAETKDKLAPTMADDPVADDYLTAMNKADEAQTKMDEAEAAYFDEQPAGGSNPGSPDENHPMMEKLNDLWEVSREQIPYVTGVDVTVPTKPTARWTLHPLRMLSGEIIDFLYDEDATDFPVAEAPSHYEVNGVYVNVKAFLINMSGIAYGVLGVDYDKQTGEWDVDKAFLLDAKDIDQAMVDEYIDDNIDVLHPGLTEYSYPTMYNNYFGLFGKTLYTQNRIDVATAMVKNQQLLTKAIEPLKEGLANLEDSKATAENEKQDLENELEEKKAEKADLEADIDAKIKNLKSWKVDYSQLLSHLTAIIAKVEEIGKDNLGDKLINEYVQDAIQWLENGVKLLQNLIDGSLTDRLDRATYQLQQYQDNEGVMTANPVKIDLDAAAADLAAAQEKLDFLKAHADELEARYKAATSNQ